MKRVLIISGIVIVVLCGLFFAVTFGMGDIQNKKVEDIDFSQVADGEYTGTMPVSRWTNTVKVTVKDKKIIAIEVVNDMRSGSDVKKTVFDTVIATQSLDVDAVSGASVTTKAYVLSIQDALKKGLKK